ALVPYVADVRSSDGLQIVLFKGIYSFSCVGNGHLDKKAILEVTCKDGEIIGQFPTCIITDTISTTENNQETGQQTSTTDEFVSTTATFVDIMNNKTAYILMYAAITIMALVLLICCTTIAIIVMKRRKQAKYSTQKGIK
ncbi:hypothetical protein B566_EDAN002600, partial [Ephemera danica]